MVKPSAPLLKSVALILNARQEIEKQPSVAKDSGTPKRTAMHLLNKMVNNIRGLSAQLLGKFLLRQQPLASSGCQQKPARMNFI